MGLKEDGSIVGWGRGVHGQNNVPTPNTDFVAIAVGEYHCLGLKSDGTVVAWGFNGHGQINVPTPNSGFAAIAAGYGHSLGLKEDGSVVGWGSNNFGEITVPSPNSGFVAIAAGSNHSLGLRSNGDVVAWGGMDRNQSREPEPKSGYVALAAGKNHSLGLLADADSDRIPDPIDVGARTYHATETECHPIGMGDADGGGVLDLRDLAELQNCFGGSHGSSGFDAPSQECLHLFDGNRDGDVDLLDFRWFRAALFAE